MFLSPPPTAATEVVPEHATIHARRAFWKGQVLEGGSPSAEAEAAREFLASSREDVSCPEEILDAAASFPFGKIMATRRRVLREKPSQAPNVITAQIREVKVISILVNREKLSRALLIEAWALLDTAENVQRCQESDTGRDVAGTYLFRLREEYRSGEDWINECAAALVRILQRTGQVFRS
jgi:hypothetical protein